VIDRVGPGATPSTLCLVHASVRLEMSLAHVSCQSLCPTQQLVVFFSFYYSNYTHPLYILSVYSFIRMSMRRKTPSLTSFKN
jgi:hypothetical protein